MAEFVFECDGDVILLDPAEPDMHCVPDRRAGTRGEMGEFSSVMAARSASKGPRAIARSSLASAAGWYHRRMVFNSSNSRSISASVPTEMRRPLPQLG